MAQADQMPAKPQPQFGEPVDWTAAEYLTHQKSSGWYGMVIFFSVALGVIAYLLLKDFVAPVLFVLIGVSVGLFGRRPAETLNYQVSAQGVKIGNKSYPMADFKSFSMIEDDGVLSIQLNPLKRFLPAIVLYLDSKDADRVANAFAGFLPHEDKAPELLDQLSRKLRF